MSSEFLTALVTIAFGAAAGGLTNAVAIWMLFHPYTPKGPGRLKLQGAIPKNKARLAKTIGRTVGQRLLTSDDLTKQLTNPEFRQAFDNAVRSFVENLLGTERGTLREEVPPGLLAEIESTMGALGPTLATKLTAFAATDDFNDAVARFLARLNEDLGERPLSEFLTPERRQAIHDRIEEWVGEAVMNPGLEDALDDWLDRQIVRLAGDTTPLLERLPAPLVAAVEKEISGYLPFALDRISAALRDPTARNNIQQSLHQLFERFVNNLLLHERIVAKLVVTEKTFTRLLDNFERDGADQVSRLFEEPEMRTQVARSVNEAVVKFLRRPLSEHLGALGAERLEGIKETAREQILTALRDSATRTYAIEKVDEALAGAETRTVGEVLKHVSAEDAAEWTSAAIASDRVQEWIAEGTVSAINGLLDRPIGRPADRLPEGSIDRLSKALAPALWDWIQSQIPTVVAQVDIQSTVEEKVAGFSLERIEQIVRATTQRELDLIVRLGYVLGAVVGAAAYGVSVFL